MSKDERMSMKERSKERKEMIRIEDGGGRRGREEDKEEIKEWYIDIKKESEEMVGRRENCRREEKSRKVVRTKCEMKEWREESKQ